MPIAGRLTERFGGGAWPSFGVSILCLGTIPLAFVGVGTSILGISAVMLGARHGHRLLLHAGDDRGVGLASAGSAVRRDPQLNVAAAPRRGDRHGRARGRASAGERGLALARQAGGRVRHGLLVVAGDRRPGADPLRGAAARREPARSGLTPRRPADGRGRRVEPLGAVAPTSDERAHRHGAAPATRSDTPSAGRGADRARARPSAACFAASAACAGATRTSAASELSHAQFELLIELRRARRAAGRRARGRGPADAGDGHADARPPRRRAATSNAFARRPTGGWSSRG